MKLFWKLSLPQAILVPILGLISYLLISSSFTALQENNLEYIIDDTFSSIEKTIEDASVTAQNTASLFSNMPAVIAAYEKAYSGNINDANSEASQQARTFLRKELAPMLANFKTVSGDKLKLHFHLPNGRSLVRLWRGKQTKKNGKWVDISDDISSFRRTVLDVNSSGKGVRGIELGRGGFVMRGLVPVTNAQGKTVGSAEVLTSFSPVFNVAKQKGVPMMLLMNKAYLNITTKLNNSEKHPLVYDTVLVNPSNETKPFVGMLNSEFLAAATKERVRITVGNYTLVGSPVRDYRGKQIGVLVGAIDSTKSLALAAKANLSLTLTLAAILLLPLLGMIIVLKKYVTSPLQTISVKIKELAENKADLRERLHINQNDEVGDLTRWFNSLMERITTMLDEMEGFKNVFNTVPDPIFAVDNDFNFILANKAVEEAGKTDQEGLVCSRCHDVFSTDVCSTPNCPIEQVKRTGKRTYADIVTINGEDGPIHIQPVADILYDAQGKKAGYIEIARNVTELVTSEQEINQQLKHIEETNKGTKEASQFLLESTSGLESKVDGVNGAVESQRQRIVETSTAMEQMNASVMEVAHGAATASQRAEETKERAEKGASIVSSSIESIRSLHAHANTMTEAMSNLGTEADNIGTVLSVISDIADQTNLLALNAAIEAARAGDAGRGFAVVADEVRKLAEKTMQATQEVNNAIMTIQGHANSSIQTTKETMQLVDTATSLANDSGNALTEIVHLANEAASQIGTIATAAEEQSSTSEQVTKAMDEINTLAGSVAAEMQEAAENVKDLSQLAQQLDVLSKQ